MPAPKCTLYIYTYHCTRSFHCVTHNMIIMDLLYKSVFCLHPLMTIVRILQGHNVTLLHYKQWPERSRPKSVSFLKFLASVESLQQPHIGRPMAILATCKSVCICTNGYDARFTLGMCENIPQIVD